jgi:antitoxin HicB
VIVTCFGWRESACARHQPAEINSRTLVRHEIEARALKRALTEQLEESLEDAKLTKLEMAKKMSNNRSQLDRVLNPENVSVQLDTLIKAARAVGKEVEIKIKRAHKRAA